MRFLRLTNLTDTISEEISRILRSSGYTSIFNPSVLEKNGTWFITFRAITSERTIDSFLLINSSGMETQNLSSYFRYKYNISKVADPKLFNFDGKVWFTFNTGYLETGNDIYIIKLDEGELVPIRCNFPERVRIEKNWMFFNDAGKLFCLYSIKPLTILRLHSIENYEAHFILEYTEESTKGSCLSIGTQSVMFNDELYFIGHKKLFFFGKRMYLGVPCKLKKYNDSWQIKTGKTFLFHSIKSLFGSTEKLNKNLLSCTYFSGLSIIGDQVLLGYGINDLEFGISEMPFYKFKSCVE